MDPHQPSTQLSASQMLRLMKASVRDASVVRVRTDLPPSGYDMSEFLANARIMLRAIQEDPPKATKTLGNLERKFVRKVYFEMEWPEAYRELGAHLKAFDEEQVLGVHVIRVVLELAKLVKKRKGRFHVTALAADLLQETRTGELYELLFRTYFGTFNLSYVSRLLPERLSLQTHVVDILWYLASLGQEPFSTEELAHLWPELVSEFSSHRWWPAEGAFSYALTAQIIDPLRQFGLVERLGVHAIEDTLGYSLPPWRPTPLFAQVIEIDLGPADPDEIFVPAEMLDIESAFRRFRAEADSAVLNQRESADSILDAWLSFVDREGPESLEGWDRERFRVRPGKKPRRFTTHFGPEFAMRLADAFIEETARRALPQDPDVVMFAALVIQEFAVWCVEHELVPASDVIVQIVRTEKLAASLSELKMGAPFVEDAHVVRLKVTLGGVKPLVWRRIEVWDDCTMGELHLAINAAMGWTNSHLHRFAIGHRSIGVPDDFGLPGQEDEDEEDVLLCDLLDVGVTTFAYEYDFGDGWRHRVIVESTDEPLDEVYYPRCTGGSNACPPEDVGGPYGYAQFVKAMSSSVSDASKQPDAYLEDAEDDPEDYRGWYGRSFDPHAFDADEASHRIRQWQETPDRPW